MDVIEDAAIAYGFSNNPLTIPTTQPISRVQPLNKLGDLLWDEVSRAGCIELLTHGLWSHKKNFNTDVVLSNPATVDFKVVRMPTGMLKAIQ